MTPQAALARTLDPLTDRDVPPRIGVGVSGGGDSVALLVLANDWAHANGFTLYAATVDHGLRPEAADEAAGVATLCQTLGVAHETLQWRGYDGNGNLQASARDARRNLLRDWAEDLDLAALLLGHTADDQAETFLMRLARGSGVDGLAGMSNDDSPYFLRPLLGTRREALRDELRARGLTWVDDPSNDDPRYDRVKARQMMAHLEGLGLTTERLLQTSQHMARARGPLRRAAGAMAETLVACDGGDLLVKRDALFVGRSDSEARIMAAALCWIGGTGYKPRFAALVDFAEALLRGETRTLNGVLGLAEGRDLRLTRELGAAQGPIAPETGATNVVWDGRWRIIPPLPQSPSDRAATAAPAPFPAGHSIRALGEDILACKGWRDLGRPRAALLGTPAIYHGDTLVAAPMAGFGSGWQAQIVANFSSFLQSH